MTTIIAGLKYTQEHEWVKIEGNVATLGITEFAAHALGDIVFIELPEVGQSFEKGNSLGVVESIKSVSDVYAPVSGEIVDSNSDLSNTPDKCGKDPYGSWMVKIKMSNPAELNNLLDEKQYREFCEQSAH